jgi:hypothetical protein
MRHLSAACLIEPLYFSDIALLIGRVSAWGLFPSERRQPLCETQCNVMTGYASALPCFRNENVRIGFSPET